MGDVVFLSRSRRQGNKAVTGPVTGFRYVITSEGTPVSEYDVDKLLLMTEPPCCGHSLPFDGKVKSFGIAVASVAQLDSIPQYLWDFEPEPEPEKPKRKKRVYTKYQEPEEKEEKSAEAEGETEEDSEDQDTFSWEVN